MEIALFWLALAVAVGLWASHCGRGGVWWFFLAVIFSPLLAGVLLAAMKDMNPQSVAALRDAATPETHVRCPDCRELVRKDASKCKHCGTALIPQ